MDTIVAVLLGAIVGLLIAILVELGRIRVSLSHLPEPHRDPAEPKEGRQMVTVNVGAVAAPDVLPVKVAEATLPEAPIPPVEAVEEPPEPPPPPPRPPIFSSGPKPGSGQLGAIKCAHCGAENSSFRTECFQCGQGL